MTECDVVTGEVEMMEQYGAVHAITRKMKKLVPADGSYGSSRRYEDALVRGEGPGSFSTIGIIFDQQLAEDQLQNLWDCLFQVIRNQQLFYANTTKYAPLFWSDGQFKNPLSSCSMLNRSNLRSRMDDYFHEPGQSGTAEELYEFLQGIKGLQHTFVLTTKEKTAEIFSTHSVRSKNFTFLCMDGDSYEVN